MDSGWRISSLLELRRGAIDLGPALADSTKHTRINDDPMVLTEERLYAF